MGGRWGVDGGGSKEGEEISLKGLSGINNESLLRSVRAESSVDTTLRARKVVKTATTGQQQIAIGLLAKAPEAEGQADSLHGRRRVVSHGLYCV